MKELLPLTLAGAGTLALLLGAAAVAIAAYLARRQLAMRWLRTFAEPADSKRARGDVGEYLAYTTARDMARAAPELDLRVLPGRLFRPHEVDLLVLTRSAVWVVECKAWKGRLVAGADGWVSWSSPHRGAPRQQRRRNPVKQARAQTRSVERHLTEAGIKAVPVREVVVFTDPDVDLDAVREEGFVLYLDELPSFFRVGPGGQGSPMPPEDRDAVCALLERMPAWDLLELEGGGRRGRLVTDHLVVRTGGGRHRISLADVQQATLRLYGWPVLRLAIRVVLAGSRETVEGHVADPTARLWMKEPDGTVRPYPLCVVRGFVRGGAGEPRALRATEPHPGNPDGAPAARKL